MTIPPHRIAFGERLRELRSSKGWTSQEDSAYHAGLDRTYISGLERGRRNRTLDVIVKLAGALDVTLSELLEGVQSAASTQDRSE